MTICYITRSGSQADRLRKLLSREGVQVQPVFAAMTGHRFDDLVVTFRLDDPIPYQEEQSDGGKRRAAEIRIMERKALFEMWPLKLRIPGKFIPYEPYDDLCERAASQ